MLFPSPTKQAVVDPLSPAERAAIPAKAYFTANSVLCKKTGTALEYRHLKLGRFDDDGEEWIDSYADELGLLANGKHNDGTGTNTFFFINHSAVPDEVKVTLARLVSEIRASKAKVKRVRVTVRGDLVVYLENKSTPGGDLSTIKCHLNSIISTPEAKAMCMDLEAFYLGSPMPQHVYMRLLYKDIPQSIKDAYNLDALVHTDGYVYVRIEKGMYGLPQAGILAYERLVLHLAKYGYAPVTSTPGYFKHHTKPISFVLVVDDFLVKYVGEEHAKHLQSALKDLYTVTTDWEAKQFCKLDLDWDYENRTVAISMKNYVAKALHRFQSAPPSRAQHSPHAWNRPVYGTHTQLTPPPDTSEPLNAQGLTRLQEIIGVFLYYARAIDSTMLVALGTLASAQSKGTEATAIAITQLLNYAATHSNTTITFHASDMYLHVHSDASYLSESRARSRAAGYHFLSSRPNDPSAKIDPDATPPPFNGAIHVLSSIMKVVLSSAAEAELGALFFNGKDAATLRTTLIDMGHPQGATPMQTDNSCASGISNKTVKQRRSKAIDMRFYWVQDRVKQGHFNVHWRRGSDNLADYFSKHHSPSHHRLMRSRYYLDHHKPTESHNDNRSMARVC